VTDDELAGLSEFALLGENGQQAGYSGPLPHVERVSVGPVSALRWGSDPPRIVFLHGGGQNAHTWDTVIVGLGQPALAVDLPGHGRSAWRSDGDYGPRRNAETLRPVLAELAPHTGLVVGMSLGGLTAIRLAAAAPELVPELVLVDVTPSAADRHTEMTDAERGTVALMAGQRVFPSFQAMVDVTTAAAPHRDVASLRRGVFHNSKRLEDGSWTWRYDSMRTAEGFQGLWGDVPTLTTPTTLVRGALSRFVADADAEAFARTAPGFREVRVVASAGHAVQSDQPLALIDVLREVLRR